MAEIKGLTGLRPTTESVAGITCPPYDVIKPGTKLESVLQANQDSLVHITLGADPLAALERLIKKGSLVEENEPCFYIYEQEYGDQVRTGILAAVAVTPYGQGEIIRHEKTFDDKVKGRLELRKKTGLTFEPVFLLTKAALGVTLEELKKQINPSYVFTSDFAGASELHGIKNRLFRVPEESLEGGKIKELLSPHPLYIADGHHRYHASLLNGQSHCLAYVCPADQARIQAYNRVIRGLIPFDSIKSQLELEPVAEFATPPKNVFAIYSGGSTYHLQARHIPADPVGRLDCSILEHELYFRLGLNHEMIMDSRYFDYYSEADLVKMKECVDAGKYDLAVALHPVSGEELMAVADAGIQDPTVVMPEKSTFFAPKILSGLFIYRHSLK